MTKSTRSDMRQSHLILSNASIMWVTQALQLLPQIFLVPYLIATIGEDGYGVYGLVWSLMMSVEQLQMSLQQGVVKYSAGFFAQGRIDEVNKVVSSSFVYSIVLAVLAFIFMITIRIYYKDPSGQIGPALFIVGVMVLLIVPLTPYIAVIQSRQRYYVGAIAGTASKYVSLLAVIAWFHFVEPSVEALIIIMAGALVFARLAQVPVAYRLVPGLRNHFSLSNKDHLRLIISFGGMVVLISLCLMVNTTGIRWLMNSLVSTVFVTHLTIMVLPSGLLSTIIGAMTITAMPATSAYQATGDQRMLKELLIRGMRYSMILTLVGLLVACFLMRNLLSLWVGADYVFLATYTLILFASEVFMQSTSIAHHMLKGLGKLRLVIVAYIIGRVIVPIGLIVFLYQICDNPYIVVTVGLVAGNLVCGYLHIFFSSKAVQANMWELLLRIYVQPLIVAVPVWLIFFVVDYYNVLDSLDVRIFISVFAVFLFCYGCYAFIATAAELKQMKEILQIALNYFRSYKGSQFKN